MIYVTAANTAALNVIPREAVEENLEGLRAQQDYLRARYAQRLRELEAARDELDRCTIAIHYTEQHLKGKR